MGRWQDPGIVEDSWLGFYATGDVDEARELSAQLDAFASSGLRGGVRWLPDPLFPPLEAAVRL